MYVLYNCLIRISCTTWRWSLSSTETCSCTLCSKYFIFYQSSTHTLNIIYTKVDSFSLLQSRHINLTAEQINCTRLSTGEGKAFPTRAMKLYWSSTSVLDGNVRSSSRSRRLLTPLRNFCTSQSQFGRFDKEKSLVNLPRIETRFLGLPIRCLITSQIPISRPLSCKDTQLIKLGLSLIYYLVFRYGHLNSRCKTYYVKDFRDFPQIT